MSTLRSLSFMNNYEMIPEPNAEESVWDTMDKIALSTLYDCDKEEDNDDPEADV